ncbi:MAG: hypothetical protein RLZ98_1286 [Pseudomonadota bacterium]|jgi:O-antigen/teichoic acid export membrane protein
MTSLGNKIMRGTVWIAIERWLDQISVLIILIVLSRLLGPEAIGLAALALAFPMLIAVPFNNGIADAVVQRDDLDARHLDTAFLTYLAAGSILGLAIWLSSGTVAHLMGSPVLGTLLAWTAVIPLVLAVEAVPAALFRRTLDFRTLAIRSSISTLAAGVVGLWLALNGYGVWSLIAMQIARVVMRATIVLTLSTWRPGLLLSAQHGRELIAFGIPITASNLLWQIYEEAPKWIIGALISPAAVGLYVLARKPIDMLAHLLVAPIQFMTMPAIARMQNDRALIRPFFESATTLTGIIGFPTFVGVAAIAPEAVPIILGNQWIDAVPVLQILMLLGLARTFDGICGGALVALGHAGLAMNLSLAYVLLMIPFTVAGATISLEATAVGIVASQLLVVPVVLYFARKRAGISTRNLSNLLFRLLISTATMVIGIMVWRSAAMAHGLPLPGILLGSIATGAATYAAVAIVLLRDEIWAAGTLIMRARSA